MATAATAPTPAPAFSPVDMPDPDPVAVPLPVDVACAATLVVWSAATVDADDCAPVLVFEAPEAAEVGTRFELEAEPSAVEVAVTMP